MCECNFLRSDFFNSRKPGLKEIDTFGKRNNDDKTVRESPSVNKHIRSLL